MSASIGGTDGLLEPKEIAAEQILIVKRQPSAHTLQDYRIDLGTAPQDLGQGGEQFIGNGAIVGIAANWFRFGQRELAPGAAGQVQLTDSAQWVSRQQVLKGLLEIQRLAVEIVQVQNDKAVYRRQQF